MPPYTDVDMINYNVSSSNCPEPGTPVLRTHNSGDCSLTTLSPSPPAILLSESGTYSSSGWLFAPILGTKFSEGTLSLAAVQSGHREMNPNHDCSLRTIIL